MLIIPLYMESDRISPAKDVQEACAQHNAWLFWDDVLPIWHACCHFGRVLQWWWQSCYDVVCIESLELTINHSYDNSDKLSGISFKGSYAKWQVDPMVEKFLRWTAESFGLCLFCIKRRFAKHFTMVGACPSNGSNEDGKRKDNLLNIKPWTDDQWYPMLLSWEVIDSEGLMYKKHLIGKFMMRCTMSEP